MGTGTRGRIRLGRGRPVAAMVALSLLLLGSAAPATAEIAPALRVTGLTTEHLPDPLGIDTSSPRLSWIDSAARNGAGQTAFQLVVSADRKRAAHGAGEMWDTGRVSSTASFDVSYAGRPLRSRTRYFWAVRVWDERGHASPWSAPAWFETAFLEPAGFGGAWIGRGPAQPAPNPLLRKELRLHGGIASARAYLSGLGYSELYINGHRIGDHVLDPSFTDYNKTVEYVTYDVTGEFRAGWNAVGVSLGNGWYAGNALHFADPADVPWQPARPKLKFELDVRYADGTSTRMLSDTSWRTADGPTTADSVQSESDDARLEQPDWARAGFDAGAWLQAAAMSAPAGQLRAQSIPPVERTATLTPVAVTEPHPGVRVYDFGVITAGWARIAMTGSRGTTVSVRYAEKLNPDGSVPDEAGQTDTYTLRGGPPETYEPHWGWRGYRYVQVSTNPTGNGTAPQLPDLRSVRGVEVHSALPGTGGFQSSNGLFNTMHEAMRRTILNNQDSFGTDTPLYEKAGWTADNRLYAESAIRNFDMESYYEKWMRDFDDAQLPDGRLPLIVPSPAPCTSSPCLDWYVTEPVWESAVILMHTSLHTYYGDVSAVRRDYAAMAAWLRNVEAEISATGYLYKGFTFGDWSVPTNAVAPSSQLIGSMFLYESAKELTDLAALAGQPADAAHFRQLAGSIAAAVNTAFYDADQRIYRDPPGTVSIGFGGTTVTTGGYSQTANLLGLAFGLAPTQDRPAIVRNLADNVTASGNHLATGANGTRWILPILTEAGYGDLAYAIATNPDYPGWAHWFEQCGATTMWEAWECDTARSRDHAFMGTVDDWFFTDLAGIQPTSPAFRTIQIKPYPLGDLTSAAATQSTPLGRVGSSWTRSRHGFRLTVDIPVGATARVLVPAAGHAMVRAPGDARFTGSRDGCATYSVGSGRYTFEAG